MHVCARTCKVLASFQSTCSTYSQLYFKLRAKTTATAIDITIAKNVVHKNVLQDGFIDPSLFNNKGLIVHLQSFIEFGRLHNWGPLKTVENGTFKKCMYVTGGMFGSNRTGVCPFPVK